MKESSKERDWSSLVSLYENSGLSLGGFCKSHGLAPSTFRYHVEKYSGKPKKRSKKFYPLVPVRESSESVKEISLDLPHGIRLVIRG
jgi:hypothetical protein